MVPNSSFLELDPGTAAALRASGPAGRAAGRWQHALQSHPPAPKLLLSSRQGKLTATALHRKKPDAQLQRHHAGKRQALGLIEPEGRQGVPGAAALPDGHSAVSQAGRGGHLTCSAPVSVSKATRSRVRPGRGPGPEEILSCPPLPPRGSACGAGVPRQGTVGGP